MELFCYKLLFLTFEDIKKPDAITAPGKTNLTNSLPHYAKTKNLNILKRLLKSNEKPRNITAARLKIMKNLIYKNIY